MIDELLARLRQWRAARDIDEALDLKRKYARLWRESERALRAREDYAKEHQRMQAAAYMRALGEAGITPVRGLGVPAYTTADGKAHIGRPAVSFDAVPYDAPPGPAPELVRELSVTEMQTRGLSREDAERIETEWEAKQETIRVRCEKRGPGLRTVDAGIDPRRPVMVSEREYNQIAGIPGRDEIVALGPA